MHNEKTIKPRIKITKNYFKISGHGNKEVTEVINFFLIQHNLLMHHMCTSCKGLNLDELLHSTAI